MNRGTANQAHTNLQKTSIDLYGYAYKASPIIVKENKRLGILTGYSSNINDVPENFTPVKDG